MQPGSPDRLFAATRHAFYESADGGTIWTERFRAPSGGSISRLAVEGSEPPAILVATDQGLYGAFDGEWRWTHVFRQAGEGEARCTHVAFHPSYRHAALLGTGGGLFISSNQGRDWTEVGLPPAAREVLHFAFFPDQPDRLLLASASGVFVGSVTSGGWRQTASVIGAEDEAEVEGPEVPEDPEAAEENGLLHRLSAVATDSLAPAEAYLGGSRGVARSADGGLTWEWLSSAGLPTPRVEGLLLKAHSPLAVYAATGRGVGRYDPGGGRWDMLSAGWTASAVNELIATETHLWAATDQGLYRYALPPDPFAGGEPPTPQELLANFVHEPTITQVRDAAIRYAEVHPDKIARWRRQAALKALLPSVDLGFDRDRSDDLSIDEGSFPNFQLIETRDRDASFDASVTWDLGELIWNDDQTSIDVRSKLMVQLRDDIVDQVTRTYFERRWLQVLLLTDAPDDRQKLLEKELRIQELTALLDGWTGGYFSKQMNVN
jgi:hypothetical protein